MEAQYVARVTDRGATHKVRDGWRYDAIGDARTGCGIKGPFGIEHMHSGRPIAITCKRAGCSGSKREA